MRVWRRVGKRTEALVVPEPDAIYDRYFLYLDADVIGIINVLWSRIGNSFSFVSWCCT